MRLNRRRSTSRRRRLSRLTGRAVMIGVTAALLVLAACDGGDEAPSTVTDPDAKGISGLPPEEAPPSTPENGELVVELTHRVWVYADGRVISSVYDGTLEPYSGLVEQHLTPEGVEFLRSNVLSTGLFEHDLELARQDNPSCCLDIRVRDGNRLVSVRLGPRYALSDHQAPIATPEQATALQSLFKLLTGPASWPASVWTDQQIRAYVPTSYSFCSRFAEPTRVVALLPEPARDLLGAKYLKADGDGSPQPTCSRMTTEEARALAGILDAEFGYESGPYLELSIEDPAVLRSSFLIVLNPVLPHGTWPWLAGVG